MKRILTAAAVIAGIAVLAYGALVWMIVRPAPPLEPGPIIRIAQGDIQTGIDTNNTGILQANGIPFAAPPIGEMRWRPPAPAAGWTGVRDGRQFGAECLQPRSGSDEFINDILKGMGLNRVQRHLASISFQSGGEPNESEDCLFLNVRSSTTGTDQLQPVMVWIHGGSHQTGSGSDGVYQGNQLVENGVVLVTINYRLSVLGYLAHPALSADDPRGVSGNYGLLDQMAALHGVRDNIAAFGGDPNNVTIFGESAGAQSVTEIMASPLSDGLFHKAILQSGASSYNANGLTTAIDGRLTMHQAGIDFFEGLAPPEASAADLRAVSADTLIAQTRKKPELGGYALPTVDGVVLPRLIGESIGSGRIQNVPILAGYNADEATLFYDSIQRPTLLVRNFPEELPDRLTYMEEIYGAEDASTLIGLYGLDDPETYQRAETDMLGDDMFGVHMRYLAASNGAQGQPSYLYHFTRVPPSRSQTIGAFHASEILFVFDSHSPIAGLTEDDKELTSAMGRYWTNFAATGDPNGPGLVHWPSYAPATDQWMTFNPSIAVQAGIRAAKLDVLERAMVDRIAQAGPIITPQEEEGGVLVADPQAELPRLAP